jgi:hypothetical protein
MCKKEPCTPMPDVEVAIYPEKSNAVTFQGLLYRAKAAAARAPSMAMGPTARVAAALVGTVATDEVLEATVEGVWVRTEVMVVLGASVAVVERLPTGAEVVLAAEDASVAAELLALAEPDAVAEADELDSVVSLLPPEMAKGNEYWKMLELESRVIWMPYTAREPSEEGTAQS